MQGGSSACLTEFPLTTPRPFPHLLASVPPPCSFSFSSFDWRRGMVIFMHHLGQQDGRTSSNYLKQTGWDCWKGIYSSLQKKTKKKNHKASCECNGSKIDFFICIIALDRKGFTLDSDQPQKCCAWYHSSGSLILFKCYHTTWSGKGVKAENKLSGNPWLRS